MAKMLNTQRLILSSSLLGSGFLVALLILGGPAVQGQSEHPVAQPRTLSDLRSGFANPPESARLRCYWWWLNGHTDKATITHDLEQMKAKGFGGALLVDANGANQEGNNPVPPGPTFGSPGWVELYTHALKEADLLGLEITLNITSGWNLGGPDVTPEQASKLLTWSRTQLQGGQAVTIQLPAPPQRNGYYRQIAVLAYPLEHGASLAPQPNDRQGDRFTSAPPAGSRASEMQAQRTLRFRSAAAETGFSMPDSSPMLHSGIHGQFAADPQFADTSLTAVQDVSTHVQPDGTLKWNAPFGDWEILRIGYTDSDARVSTSSGAWQGLAIDYLSRDAFETYWAHAVDPLLTAAKPFHSLKYLATDSWELGGTNWTPSFRNEFIRLRGYDPVPWLPVVAGRIVGDRDQSTRFLTDLRRTVADLIVSNHYDVFAEKAREHGMGLQAESGGPHGAPIDALETFRHSAVPQTEFWAQNAHRSKDVERFFVKEASSAAHIYGQPLVADEGETSVGPQWSESLATDLKPTFDMAVTEGMNRLVWHEFTSSPASTGLPGQEYFAGTHVDPKITWWNASPAFFAYLNRVQFLMQRGQQVDDLLYFYGDNVPNFVRLKADDPAQVLPGYDYDVTDEDALLHTIHTEGGKLVGPEGMHWRALALPNTGRLSLSVLRLVDAYVREGGAVIGTAPDSPTGMMTPAMKTEYDALVQKLWGASCPLNSHRAYGKGQVFCTRDAHAALAAMKVLPDVTVATDANGVQTSSSTAELDYVHRRFADIDIYFLRNGSDHASQHAVIFRISGKTPQLWDAVTGEMHRLNAASLADGRMQVPLALPPFGSAIVIFAHDPARLTPLPTNARSIPANVLGNWSVTFQPGRGAPEKPLSIDQLKSWTEWPEPGVRYFSGTATYRARVEAPQTSPRSEIWLQFDDVREIAQLKVNGHDAGTVWAKPLMVRVDHLLKPGENTLEIQVTNLWPNRIIGDLQPGATQHFTQTNITAYKADTPLLPSGLIGPVRWVLRDALPSSP